MNVSRYDGCGNTFSIVKHEAIPACDLKALAIQICSHDNFDTDGLMIVKADPLEMIFYNRDGSWAPMCGNGIRCFAKYVIDQGLVAHDIATFDVMTGAGLLQVEIVDHDPFLCQVNMGQPIFTPAAVKLGDAGPLDRILQLNGQEVTIHSLFMGTIHTVVFIDEQRLAKGDDLKPINDIQQTDLGQQICNHPLFTEKTNVNFVQVKSNTELIVRTYERGVGWTKACGTGCCAAAVVAKKLGHVTEDVVAVYLEEGKLIISNHHDIYMAGPARYNDSCEFSKQR